MKRSLNVFVVCLVVALGTIVWLPANGSAADKIAEITGIEGRVDILRGGKLPSEKAAPGAELFVGDFVRTKSRSSAELLFVDGNRVSIKERSRVDIQTYALDKDQRTLNLSRGKVEAVVVPKKSTDTSERPKRFEIHTPNAVAGVRGTTLVVSFQDSTTAILVKELHGGRSVYSLSKFHPDELFDIPEGGMMWVSNKNLPTSIPPSSSLEYKTLAAALKGNVASRDIQVLVDAMGEGLDRLEVPLVTDAFPELLKPTVEVGTVAMVNQAPVFVGTYSMDVSMTAHFLALTADTAPLEWWSDDVSINWGGGSVDPFDPTDIPVAIATSAVAASVGDASAVFSVSDWNPTTGEWVAVIDSGAGSLPTDQTFVFVGVAAGTGAEDGFSGPGTATGDAIGLASPTTQ